MHIALAANGWCVPQLFGNDVDGLLDIFLRLRLRAKFAGYFQRLGSENRARPCPKILRREIAAADFAQVLVYVPRGNVMALALAVNPLKKILSGNVLTDRKSTRLNSSHVSESR